MKNNGLETTGCLASSLSPFDVGSRAQLFVDRVLVGEAQGMSWTQHPGRKHPANPLVRADRPWEGWRLEIFGSVLYDEQEKQFKMWYLADAHGVEGYCAHPFFTCYATSSDGVHWEKPLVGTLASKSGRPHNAVAFVHLASVIKEVDEPDPVRRYKMIARLWLGKPGGYHTFVSPDGLHWTRHSEEPISPWADVITGFWDHRRQLYVAFPKMHDAQWRGHKRRLFYTITSSDFCHWSKPVLSWTTDLRDDAGVLARLERVRPILDRPDDPALMRTEYYGIGVYPAESCTLGFPWVLTINNDARWGNHEGPQEIQLAVSRDLVHWERPFRTPVIGHGQLDQWDASYQVTAARAIDVGDEVWLYYAGANYTHGTPALYRTEFETGESTGRTTRFTSSIGLVTWKRDRFVSVDGPAEGGTLTTVPVRFEGDRLEINARTAENGSVVVELCDAVGRPIEEFAPSNAFIGDALRHVVTFGGQSDVSRLSGAPVVLRFVLHNAELYSFAFRLGGAGQR